MSQDPATTDRAIVAAVNKPYYQIVREMLADNIASGNLPAGTLLLASVVADRLQVSRPPVKRALELLIGDGIISEGPERGYVVGQAGSFKKIIRTNLHGLALDLPAELAENRGQPSWERIYDETETEVLNCIPFGTFQISESMMGEHFVVSRTVVREVLLRLDARHLITKDRSSHWLAGPFSARMLDEAHAVRRLMEPCALEDCAPRLQPGLLEEMRGRLGTARRTDAAPSPNQLDGLETDLHVTLLQPLRNRRLAEIVRLSQISLVINRLFARHIGVHDETDLLNEHRLVLDHLELKDVAGATAALRRHLDLDHQRARARLKVLSIVDAPSVPPYLSRVH